jgi:hypothetical protein
MAFKLQGKSRADKFLESAISILKLFLLVASLPIIIILQYEFGLLDKFSSYLNSPFSQAFISSFAGAIGAAGLIYYLDYKRRKREFLIAVNTALAVMAGHISTILNYKVQHLIPLKEEKDSIVRLMSVMNVLIKNNPEAKIEPPVLELRLLMQKLPMPHVEFMITLDKLSEFAERFPQAMILVVKAKEGLDSFKSFLAYWDELVTEMRLSDLPDGVKLPYYLGKTPVKGNFDTRVPNVIDNMLKEADNALFFLRLASEELQEKAQKILPKGIASRLAKSVTKAGYEVHMPPRDLVEGWNDE